MKHVFTSQSHSGTYSQIFPVHQWIGRFALWLLASIFFVFSSGKVAQAANQQSSSKAQAAIQVVQQYAQAVSSSDLAEVAKNDFICQLKMVQARSAGKGDFSSESAQIYPWCWQRLVEAHAEVIEHRDRGLDELWPGVGKLVNFTDFKRFLIAETGTSQRAPSFFVMPEIGLIAGWPGYSLEVLNTTPLPHASFVVQEDGDVVAVPTILVQTRIAYPNPITSPAANGPGQKDWVVPYKKPIYPLKAVTVNWVVLTDLRKYGFPTDSAVLNIPLESSMGTPIPFVIEPGGFQHRSEEYWTLQEVEQALNNGVNRAKVLDNRRDRIAMLNRVLVISPSHLLALQAVTDELYEGLLAYAGRNHGIRINNKNLYKKFNELYWTIQSHTDRWDISLHMEMGGKAEPTPADYLYRMIPAMEALADLQPGDFENRLNLSMTYQWSNDQLTAIMAPQQLLSEVPEHQKNLRAKILLTLAWSRISKVAWNRHFDDPDITRGYEEADKAFQLTSNPIDKFLASYAKAYSLMFHPKRDNTLILRLLTDARAWYQQIPGSSEESWAFLLQNDTMKGLVETDPVFQLLLTSNLKF